MEDLDQYLNGTLDADGQRRFEERLAGDPSLQAELLVRQGLQHLRISKKVEAAALTRRRLHRKQLLLRLLFIISSIALLCAALFLLLKPEQPASPVRETRPLLKRKNKNPAETAIFPEKAAPPAPEKQKKQQNNQPIAEAQPESQLSVPLNPSPTLRGAGSENPSLKALLDQLWYIEYPPAGWLPSDAFAQADQLLKTRDFSQAYIRLQRLEQRLPANDTLRFLKGYCLMEMGEGAEALQYFEKLEATQPALLPVLQWYRALCLLLAGERQKADAQFQTIARMPDHPYSLQSKKALQILAAFR